MIHPKVKWPNVVVAVAGAAVVIVGFLTHDDSVKLLGAGVLASVGIHLPIGYQTKS